MYYLALVSTMGAYLLFYYILREAGIGVITLSALGIPVFAILLGSWVLGEMLLLAHYLGFFFLSIGSVVIDGWLAHELARSLIASSQAGFANLCKFSKNR